MQAFLWVLPILFLTTPRAIVDLLAATAKFQRRFIGLGLLTLDTDILPLSAPGWWTSILCSTSHETEQLTQITFARPGDTLGERGRLLNRRPRSGRSMFG